MPFHNHFPIILLSILCSAVIGQQACHQPQPTETVSTFSSSSQEAEEIIANFNANKPSSQHGEFHRGSARLFENSDDHTVRIAFTTEDSQTYTYELPIHNNLLALLELPERAFTKAEILHFNNSLWLHQSVSRSLSF